MRLLLVINGLGTGGAERSTAELLPALAEAGIRTTVACLHARSEGVQDAVVDAGFDVRLLPGRGLPAKTLALRRLLRRVRPDLVHTTIFEADLAGRLAAAGGPLVLSSLVTTAYDAIRREDPNVRPLRLRAARAVDGWTARRLNDHFHAISRTVKRSAVAALRLDPEQVTVIERGRDPARLGEPSPERRRRVRARLGLDDDTEVLIAVGRQEYPKGQRYLLEAVAGLAARRPRAVLLLAGRRGHATAELEELVRRHDLGRRVRLLGHRDDVPDLLAASDVFVFPSLYEGLGGALLEAMALGLPVVASDLEVFREVVEPGRSALLVPRRDAVALAGAIDTLLADPDRAAAFGRCGRARFLDRFTTAESHRRMIALYRRLTAGDVRAR